MRVVLLGTGCPPPNPRRRGPAVLASHGGTRVLLDAGSGVAAQLVQAGVPPTELEHVCLTHLHSDHVVDLGHLVLSRWILGENRPLRVYGPAGTREHVTRLRALWAWDVGVRRAHMVGRDPPAVEVTEVEPGPVLDLPDLRVLAFEVEHDPARPAFGFRLEAPGRTVVVSGDTRPCNAVVRHARGADLLIHECTDATLASWRPGCGWPTREAKVRTLASYHTGPDQVGEVAAGAGVPVLVLTHLMPASDPADLRTRAARAFDGTVVVGEDLLEV